MWKKTTSINILKKDIVKKIKKFIQIRPLNICLNYNSPFDKILEEQYPYTHPTKILNLLLFYFNFKILINDFIKSIKFIL